MPRPSLERTIKYIPVVPWAHSKLSQEAGRVSFELRKLVGHANFLDTLIENLHLGETETVQEETHEEIQREARGHHHLEGDVVDEDPEPVPESQQVLAAENDSDEDAEEAMRFEESMMFRFGKGSVDDDDEEYEDGGDLALTRTVSSGRRGGVVVDVAMLPGMARSTIRPGAEPEPLAAVPAPSDEEVLMELENGATGHLTDLRNGDGYLSEQVIHAERAQVAETIAAIVDETAGVPAV